MINEENFTRQLKDKNPEALEYMMQNFTPLLFNICKAVMGEHGTSEDIEECVSDLFVFVWENGDRYIAAKASFKTWISAIAKYKAIDFRRKLLKKMDNESRWDLEQYSSRGLEEEVLSKELNSQLITLVKKLKELDKKIFIKRYFLNASVEEIAKELDLTRQAVENRLYRTRKILKAELSSQNKEVLV